MCMCVCESLWLIYNINDIKQLPLSLLLLLTCCTYAKQLFVPQWCWYVAYSFTRSVLYNLKRNMWLKNIPVGFKSIIHVMLWIFPDDRTIFYE